MRRWTSHSIGLGTLLLICNAKKAAALQHGKRSEFNVVLTDEDYIDNFGDLLQEIDNNGQKITGENEKNFIQSTFDQTGKSIKSRLGIEFENSLDENLETEVTDSWNLDYDPENLVYEKCYTRHNACTPADLSKWFRIESHAYWEHYNRLFNNCKWQLESLDDNEQFFCSSQGTKNCVNLYNHFECQCKDGFKGDLCQRDNRDNFYKRKCLENQHYECSKPEIEELFFDQKENARKKIDHLFDRCFNSLPSVDECSMEGTFKCENIYNGRRCECNPRFTGFNCETRCEDHEVVVDNHCRELTCDEGYEFVFSRFSENYCEDINECDSENPPCHHSELCNNLPGSYECTCPVGTLRDGPNFDGFCHKPLSCPIGFQFNAKVWACDDIDECQTNSCNDNNASCFNFPGGYDCVCDGIHFIEDFRNDQNPVENTCVDRDECQEAKDSGNLNSLCPKYHTCNNIHGSYDCQPSKYEDSSVETEIIDNHQLSFYCKDGYQSLHSEDNEVRCTDIDECLDDYACPEHHICKNIQGSHKCLCAKVDQNSVTSSGYFEEMNRCNYICNSGYHEMYLNESTNKLMCLDENECITSDPCGENSDCHNQVGSYSCTCHKGYQMDNNLSCTDIDECNFENSCNSKNTHCVNNVGSFTCECNSGYEKIIDSCVNINECKTVPNFCDHMKGYDSLGHLLSKSTSCHDEPGSATCSCSEGYQFNSITNKCQDIDECEVDRSLCHINEYCKNTIGSYNCKCINGYNLNEETNICEDIDECSLQIDKCGINTNCINLPGSHNCICKSGFTSQNYESNNCDIDINECEQETNPCDGKHNEVCINGYGNYSCQCEAGYFRNENGICVDKNECDSSSPYFIGCGENQNCVNTAASFICPCNDGFKLSSDPNMCNDLNECLSNIDDCHNRIPGSECENTVGSYICTCPTGYRLEEGKCEEIDECAENSDLCSSFGTDGLEVLCINKPGSYECQCRDGYENNDGQCVDINECRNVICPENSVCKNIAGSYMCDCVYGYERHLNTMDSPCRDIDECKNGNHDCPDLATCENTDGEYKCKCPNGYVLQKDSITGEKTCLDIDECSINMDQCDQQSICINTPGDYICKCITGYQHINNDLFYCMDVNECDSISCGDHSTCENFEGGYNCNCDIGYMKTNEGTCVDIDECSDSNIATCQNSDHQICNNTEGSYFCSCTEGFSHQIIPGAPEFNQEIVCEDINECEDSSVNSAAGICGQLVPDSRIKCENTIGSYNCNCKTGYEQEDNVHGLGNNISDSELAENNFLKCEDMDECILNENLCPTTEVCRNIAGSYTCECMIGYEMKDGFCQNIDECLIDNGNCPTGTSLCWDLDPLSSPNTHECICDPGYEMKESKCVNINECDDPSNIELLPNQLCVDTIGSYNIQCTAGFEENNTIIPGIMHCTKINHCSNDPCGENTICTSGIDTFECDCKAGFNTLGLNELKCTDINECLSEDIKKTLPENSICENTNGSYKVSCKSGFRASDKNYKNASKSGFCRDINECSKKSMNSCRADQKCVNEFGDYRCVDIPVVKPVRKSIVVEELKNDLVDNLPQKEDMASCAKGFNWSLESRTCQDIDECSIPDQNTCAKSDKPYCLNIHGGFKCYKNSKEASPYQCHQRMRRHKNRAFTCRCVAPFILDSDRRSCRLPDSTDTDKYSAYTTFRESVRNSSVRKYASQNIQCPENTIHIGRLCYIQGKRKMNSKQANRYCKEHNGRLAKIHVRSVWWILSTNTMDTDDLSIDPRGTVPFYFNSNYVSSLLILTAGTENFKNEKYSLVANYYKNIDIVPPQLNAVDGTEPLEFWCEFSHASGTFPTRS